MEYRRTIDRNPWIKSAPHPKQRQFLLLADVREAFYGGAGGGGKSEALWYAALQYVDTPGYAALILRREYTDLSLPKSLMQRGRAYLTGTGARWNGETHTFTFPSGATVTFGHAKNEGDERRYASAEFQFIGIDELTEWQELQYRFLFTRLRRPIGLDVPLRVRSASNPGGVGHEWVKRRFVDPKSRVADAVFVPAKIADNPSLDQDEYRASLANVDPITRAQIEDGNWDAHVGGRFKREWMRYYQRFGDGWRLAGRHVGPTDVVFVFLTVDPAASAQKTAKADPDYTVASVWGVTRDHQLLWLDCVRVRLDTPDIPPLVLATYRQWKATKCGIEAVAGNRAVLQLCQRLAMNVVPLQPLGEDKLVRATEAMNLAEGGRLWLPESAAWKEDAESELLRFTGDAKKDGHDDVVDTLSYAAKIHREFEAGGQAIVPYVYQ